MKTIASISFFRYKNINKLWALPQMRYTHKKIIKNKGIHFYKMMGTGGGDGFSLIPDFSTYALLIVWNDKLNTYDFFNQSEIYHEFKEHAHETWSIIMVPVHSHGKWSGINPFPAQRDYYSSDTQPIAVITRASINRKKAWQFWRTVPHINQEVFQHRDLIFTKGIGEFPLIEQATFSIWKTKEAMVNFAYQSEAHKKAIIKTKLTGWYDEELFARFIPVDSIGKWKGKNLLANINY